MFSNPKHVLCTNEIIWHISQVCDGCPWHLNWAQFCILLGLHHVLELKYIHFWCILGTEIHIYANILISRRLKINCSEKRIHLFQVSAWKKCFGEMIQPFCRKTHFGNSHWPVLGASAQMPVGWDGIFLFKMKTEAERRKNMSLNLKRNLKISGRRTCKMDVKGRVGQKISLHGGEITEGWERLGLGNCCLDMCYFKAGSQPSSLQKQDREVNREGWVVGVLCPSSGCTLLSSMQERG